MSDLRRHSQDYLTVRRALGYKLVGEGGLLTSFVTYAESSGASRVTTDLAVAWTATATAGSRAYLARRMRVVRCFARYLQTLDPATVIPPSDLFPNGKYRPTPYIYSDADVAALMAAARTLIPALRAATFETLLGLLYSTGLRISEAMALDRDDVDGDNQTLTVRDSKFGKSREVLLHHSTVEALQDYSRTRDKLSPCRSAPSLFVSTRGTRLLHTTIYPTFRALLSQAGLAPQPSSAPQPHVHGLRHSFAVNTVVGWYRDGGDVAVRMPLLSTYLGHVDPAATYWYLTAVPELLALAAERLELACPAP
ncbi:MAG: tyrosine-type recombinase/integrase [Mycobacterium sp.]